MVFYFCRQNLFDAGNIIEIDGHTEITGKYLWTDGHKFPESIPEQILILDPGYGTDLPAFFDTTVPVMSCALIDKLNDLGVENIDCYPVVLKREDTGEEYRDYKMVNFVGCLDAIDYSKVDIPDSAFLYDGPVVIDEEKVNGVKAFRLKTPVDLLVVSEDVAKALIEENFKALLLQPTESYAGD